MNYDDFLKSKSFLLESSGFDANEVDEHLYPFHLDIVTGKQIGRAHV